MSCFFSLEQNLPAGAGFSLWSGPHLGWLCISAAITAALCLSFRRLKPRGRRRMRVGVGCAVLLCEALRVGNLLVRGCFSVYELPLHLCGLAVFFTFYNALRPGETVDNFLYSTCMPGAVCALLFPDWTAYPAFSFVSLVGFTVHGLLAAYPLMLLAGGSLRPRIRCLPRCLALLLALALPIYLLDLRVGANYMFLLWPSPGSPLEWFAGLLGVPGYLLGYLPLLALTWCLLYLPFRRKHAAPAKI